MDQKLKLAIETIFLSLTTTWEDNGNIMADAVIDQVYTNLSELTGLTFDEIQIKIDTLVDENQ